MAKTEQSQDVGSIPRGFTDLDVELLIPADWNYKQDDERKQAKLAANIKRNGQVESIIVREMPTGFFEVVNGNHRLAAFLTVGQAKAHVFNVGVVSDAAARRLAVETNETRFDSDPVKLAELLTEIEAEFGRDDIVETMPYEGDEIENMSRLLDFDWDKVGADLGKGKEDKEKNATEEIIKIKCQKDKVATVKEIIEQALEPFKSFVKIG